jgi:hypothetical protein
MKVSFSLLLAILGVAGTKANVCDGDNIVTILYKSTDASPPDGLIDVIQTDYTNDGAIMVKFDIKNTFSVVNEEFFVQFNEQVVRAAYNDKCYAEENVAINTVMAGNSFEAVCMGHGTPFALINLYVLNGNVGSATLPICCHGGDGSGIESNVDINVDQYVFHVLCECPQDTPAPVPLQILNEPTAAPIDGPGPTAAPIVVSGPTAAPSASPTAAPSASPSAAPSAAPSTAPSEAPSVTPVTYCETPAPPVIFESVAQGVCGDYAVHAQTTITFGGEGTTVQDGDVGVSPNPELNTVTDASGTTKIVNGEIKNHNTAFEKSVQLNHQLAMVTRQDGHEIGVEIGGMEFLPGTYRSTSAINFASGTVVTLDGDNQENPVFLFQSVSTLVTAADTHFILKNGATAENILWAVGSGATIGARSVIEGSIIASTSITFGTASAIHGCALALAAITFESHGYSTLVGFGYRTGIQEYTDGNGAVCDTVAEADVTMNPSFGQHSLCQNFAMNGRTTITFASSVQSVIVNGDIGVFPGTSITQSTPVAFDAGFGIESGDFAFGASVKAAHYLAMVARPEAKHMEAEMKGVTFTPGTYRATSTLNIAVNGIVYLDGENQVNPVFLFQCTTSITTGADTKIILLNGARAENVLWAIGASATLGARSVVEGSILAKVSITLGTESEVRGCALAQAAITTDNKATVGLLPDGRDYLMDYITGTSNALTAEVISRDVCGCDCYPQEATLRTTFVDHFLSNDVCENYGLFADTSITFGSGHTTVHNGDVGSLGAITHSQEPNLVNGVIIRGVTGTNPAFSLSFRAKYDAVWAIRGSFTPIADAMGSLSFPPGSYYSDAALSMAAKTVVTLDGQNQVDPQFVFVAETSFLSGADCHFRMINGAKAENVLWVLGTTATFGADSTLQGSVIAGTSITYGLRSTVVGCVIAKVTVSFADKGFVTFETSSQTLNQDVPVQYAMDGGEACPAPVVVTVEPIIDIDGVVPDTYCETTAFGFETTSAAVCKNYAMHAKTAISFSGEGSTVQSGDVGVSDGTDVTVASHLFVVDGEVINGNTDFEQSVRLNHALAIQVRSSSTTISPEIGGLKFEPGTYRSGSTINIAYNTFVELDGLGDPNAVFLFQAVTSLTTAAQTYFKLTNGAKAENVLWAMGAAATLGADSVLEGSLIVGTSITFGTQARLHGCALALAAITMESKGYINFVGMGTNSASEFTDASGAVCDSLSESSSDSYSLHSVCQNYAVHARTTVTFASAASAISGDVGVFPGTSVTHVNPIAFTGGGIKYRDGDFAASVLHAHFEALNVRNDGNVMAIEMGGETFAPGTHRSASAINIAHGKFVTLNAGGNPDAVFVFQAGTTLTTAADTYIFLTGGAQAKNVLWALGSAATLGANSVLEGSILAGTAITFGIGAELRGCALAQSAVTFESDGTVSYANDGSDNLMHYLNDINASAGSTSSVCSCDCYPSAVTSLTSDSEYVSNGICQNYAVHAQTEVTFASSASTIHYGDVGSSGTGVTSVAELNLVNGEISNGNTAFASSVTSAWVAAMAPQGTLIGIELGGQIFTPGTYYSTSAMNLVHGAVVTLDGDGDYLFQANTTLVTAADTYFLLINGAKAENIVWALGTAATLGARSVLQGSILAGTSITFGDMSILRGCALAQAAVTFESGGFVTFDSVVPANGLEYTSTIGDSCDSPIAAISTFSNPVQATEEQGLCENFAVHARTTVTFASNDAVRIENGDVGVSPGTSITSVTDIAFVNGEIADGDSAFASSVLAAHFAAIQVRTDGKSMEIEMAGVTFTPGTHRSGSAINFAVDSGVVTLDGAGEYLFQAGSTLVTAANTRFNLINGAKAENVLWALGSGATLGANSVLPGSILAGTAITFGIGAELQGCALAQSAVTFEGGGSVILSPNRDPSFARRATGLVGNRALLRGPN